MSRGSTAGGGLWKVLRVCLVDAESAENPLGCRLGSDTCTLRPGACLGGGMHLFVRRTKGCSEKGLQLGLPSSVLPGQYASPCPSRKVFLQTSVLHSGLPAGLVFSGPGVLIVFFRPSHHSQWFWRASTLFMRLSVCLFALLFSELHTQTNNKAISSSTIVFLYEKNDKAGE